MAKEFGKSPVAKRFEEVAKATMKNTDITAVKLIEDSALIDYPNNGEDISYTEDIENSINELGFTDPIEVTDFKMPEGKYMIVSGHRRRAAGVKCGMDLFPCIIKSFDSEDSVQNYVLLANSHRDSAKDPLLFCNRFKMHEQHLKNINFQGSVREEIAKRLGISVRQADRYNQMNKIIPPVWDLVREELVGMSSVLPMADLSPEEQNEVFEILKKYIDDGTELTREKVNYIIKDYKNPPEDSPKIKELNNKKRGNVLESIKKLNDNLTDLRDFGDEKEAENLLKAMEETFDIIFGKFYSISKRYDFDSEIEKIVNNLTEMLKNIE
jgi:Predicted transcriptional regulators